MVSTVRGELLAGAIAYLSPLIENHIWFSSREFSRAAKNSRFGML